MRDRACVRGCKVRGEHYAACVDYGRSDGDCKGCVLREARDGVLVCDRCYGQLRRRVEAVPDLIGHLRTLADPRKAIAYDRIRVQSSGPEGSPAPVAADLLDACRDIMHAIGGPQLEPGEEAAVAFDKTKETVELILEDFDGIANDRDAVLEWWRLIMSPSLDDLPEFWTVARAMQTWPMEDRRHRAGHPCPECGLRNVTVTPPRLRGALTWFACSCGWRKSENDDDGLWAAAFGQYAPGLDERSNIMAPTNITKTREVDLSPAILDGIAYVLDNQEPIEQIGELGVLAAAIVGAVPGIAEQFALIADGIAADVRTNYANGALIAGGARMVAAAIRASVTAADAAAALADLAGPKPEDEAETFEEAA